MGAWSILRNTHLPNRLNLPNLVALGQTVSAYLRRFDRKWISRVFQGHSRSSETTRIDRPTVCDFLFVTMFIQLVERADAKLWFRGVAMQRQPAFVSNWAVSDGGGANLLAAYVQPCGWLTESKTRKFLMEVPKCYAAGSWTSLKALIELSALCYTAGQTAGGLSIVDHQTVQTAKECSGQTCRNVHVCSCKCRQ